MSNDNDSNTRPSDVNVDEDDDDNDHNDSTKSRDESSFSLPNEILNDLTLEANSFFSNTDQTAHEILLGWHPHLTNKEIQACIEVFWVLWDNAMPIYEEVTSQMLNREGQDGAYMFHSMERMPVLPSKL